MDFLAVEGVTKHFGGITAVAEVSFTMQRHEVVGLIGPNGAGKTTLFHLLAGAYRPDRGRVRFLGREVQGLQPYRICRLGIARTFQVVRPFAQMTCLENVIVGCIGTGHNRRDPKARRAEAERILTFVGLGDWIEAPAASLNLINKKRLEMARALATHPQLILLDEVLGGLGSGEMDGALQLIRTIREQWGIAILWIEHVMGALMQGVDRVLVLDQGRLIASGGPREVVADRRVIEAYLGETDD